MQLTRVYLIFLVGVGDWGWRRATLKFYFLVCVGAGERAGFFRSVRICFSPRFFFFKWPETHFYIYIYIGFLECAGLLVGVEGIFVLFFFLRPEFVFHWLRFLFFLMATLFFYFIVFHKVKELSLFSKFQTTIRDVRAKTSNNHTFLLMTKDHLIVFHIICFLT